MKKLQDQVAVLTGGTRGLGFSMARAFVREGAAVVVASRSQKSVEQAVNQLRSSGGRASGLVCNVEDYEQVRALVDHAVDVFGRLDIWVNNAGVSCPTGPTAHIPHEMVGSLIKTNILGVYHGSTAALRHFASQNSGKLINISGKGEKKAFPLHNAYASSKAWEHNFTMALAKEYRDTGIGVFLFNPGVVESDMFHNLSFIRGYEQNIRIFKLVMGMLANPPEIAAEKAVWLASGATDGRTGLRISLVGPGAMLKAVAKELGRRITRRKPKPFDVNIRLIEPEIVNLPSAKAKKKTVLTPKSESNYIFDLGAKKLPETVGNKAQSLRFLRDKKFLIPETYVCPWNAYENYAAKRTPVLEKIKTELEKILDSSSSYAVRSSANIEDSLDHSFAGQFDTYLDLQGVENICQAVLKIWETIHSETVKSYLNKIRKEPGELKMAVIIQKMVHPVLSGVVFSKNPISALDEILVEAVKGSGTALVQDGVTPLRWINKWGGWVETPESDDVPLEIIQKVVNQANSIKRAAGRDIDLEWVYDGKDIYWLQARNITSIERMNVYSSRMAKEMTPGMIKPLVWSVVVPIPSRIWADMIREVVGKIDLDAGNLAKSFHYRTYHNLSEFGKVFSKLGMPAESLEMMMGVIPPGAGKAPFKPGPKMIRLVPKILRFAGNRWRFAKKLEKNYSRLYDRAKKISLNPSSDLDDKQLLDEIDRIKELNFEMTFYTINAILLLQIYSGILKTRLKKAGIDFQAFDLTEGMEELKLYDPKTHLEALNLRFNRLDEDKQRAIESADFHTFLRLDGIEDFRGEVQKFIERFGHMSDTTGHFGSVPWRETPGMILELIINHKAQEGSKNKKFQLRDLERMGKGGVLTKLFVKRSRQFSLFREKYSSLFSYALMLFRVYYLAVGDHIVRRGLIESREDVYFLFDGEIRSLIAGERSGADLADLVNKRKRDMEAVKDAVLPEIIFGENTPPVVTEFRDKLKGTPTSKGYYKGVSKSVHGIAEFSKLEQGDVLVIPYSDVSWTPLFAKAGAVVAESGGMLSHSSIIAREYNIPAVVSVKGSLQLQDETLVTVDGFKGEVIVHQKPISKPNRTDMGGKKREGKP